MELLPFHFPVCLCVVGRMRVVWFYGRGDGTRENSTTSVNRGQPVLHMNLIAALRVPWKRQVLSLSLWGPMSGWEGIYHRCSGSTFLKSVIMLPSAFQPPMDCWCCPSASSPLTSSLSLWICDFLLLSAAVWNRFKSKRIFKRWLIQHCCYYCLISKSCPTLSWLHGL